MSFIKLEPKCPKKSPTLPSVDPDPNWTFDGLLLELQQLESNLGMRTPSPLKKPPIQSRDLKDEDAFSKSNKSFVMKILDFDTNDDSEDESDNGSYSEDKSDDGSYDDSDMGSKGARFSCVDFDLSDYEESEIDLDMNISKQSLINKTSLEEGILFEFDRERQLKYKEQVRTMLSVLEIHNEKAYEMSEHSMLQIEKYIEDRREIDRQLDMQHQQKISEVLDSHLSALQKDHEEISLIEEQRLKDAAALEAERKRIALQEERLRREKEAKLAEENRLAAKKAAAEEAAKKAAAEEAAATEAAATEAAATEAAAKADADLRRERQKESKESECLGIKVFAADVALKTEEDKLKAYNNVAKDIPNIPSKDFKKYGRRMTGIISKITGSETDVRNSASEFVHILNDSVFPPPVRCFIFAQKVLSFCESRGGDERATFALARVVVLVSSQVPSVVDLVLAEFYKACIYTVPKHLDTLNAAAKNKNYWKMVGYREENDRLESWEIYRKRVQNYMQLFAAIIQTEIQGIRNPYGLEQGWTWLAMFLNNIPPSITPAYALFSFLKIAGYGLHRRYKSQFVKMMNVVWKIYLPKLKKEHPNLPAGLETYLEDRGYDKEPVNLKLQVQESLSDYYVP